MIDELPRMRGILHAYAVVAAVVAAVVLVLHAPGAEARGASIVYGAALVLLFSASALYHRWPGSARWKAVLRRIDHSTIFVFIAASYTPVAVLALDGVLADVVLVSVWVGAAAGVVLSVGWIDAPRVLQAACYVAVGGVAVVAFPEMLSRLGVAPTALIAAGGALYTAGAIIYARQRPDPWPRTFGYHELFHLLVIAAAALHFAAMAGWVVPAGQS